MGEQIKVSVYGDIKFRFKSSGIGSRCDLLELNSMIEDFNASFQEEMEDEFTNLKGDFVQIDKFEITREVEDIDD